MMKLRIKEVFILTVMAIQFSCNPNNSADLILTNGKIITVDQKFSIKQAVAIENNKIVAVGTDKEIKKLADRKTKIIDLKGKTVIPGLIDSHCHPESASLSELNEKLPDLHTIVDLLNWIKSQSMVKQKGEWIILPKFFFTRIKELRQPSLSELDSVAPSHPVFLNGSFGGMINSAAIKVSNISDKTIHHGIIKDKKTGKLTGFIRASAFGLLKLPPERELSSQEELNALQSILERYNQYGITGVTSGAGDIKTISMYQNLRKENKLTVRVYQNMLFEFSTAMSKEEVIDTLKTFKFKTGDGDDWVRIGPLKIVADGGILTGTGYLREPWGDKAQHIFGFEDKTYQGVLNYSRAQILSIVSAANELGWGFAAHATGGGSVDLLLDVFEEVNHSKPINGKRFSIIHGNFYTKEAIRRMSELGVCANAQPAWFYKDADAMLSILGEERMETFHPNRSMQKAGVIINGGSDHMVKLDANASINPYNPFLAIWTMVTRKTEKGNVIMPSEAITREDALKTYTINNAYSSFEEAIKGSIEPGKLADFAVLSDDILTCPVDQIKNIQSELTIVGGKIVYDRKYTKL